MSYYSKGRTDLLEWLRCAGRRTLDVGCGSGANAPWLRAHGTAYLEGVEPHESSTEALGSFDHVHQTTIEEALPSLGVSFDLIICADVLEHLVDPATVLRSLRQHLAPNGRLGISVPNVRYLPALLRIAFGAGFRPEASGTFDGTHLHFFTKRNVDELLTATGWQPRRWGYGSHSLAGRVRSMLGRITFGISDEWLVGQWFVEAVLPS